MDLTKTAASSNSEPDLFQVSGGSPPSEYANPYDTIPAELRERSNWVTWRREARASSKPAKRPYDPKTDLPADVTNSNSFGTFEQATQSCKAPDCAGIGYGFSPDDPYTGIDLDHCRNPITGAIAPEAQAIVDKLDSYTEVSPSGDGLHTIVQGRLLDGSRNRPAPWANGKIELYDQSRYFTVTGDHLPGTPTTIEPRQDQLTALVQRLTLAATTTTPNLRANPQAPTNLADDALLAKARAAANGPKFSRLFDDGDSRDYPSDSEADQALCDLLAFSTGGDVAQMDRLFRRSKLYRPEKWDAAHSADGRTYGQLTIAKALAYVTNRYEGGASLTPTTHAVTKPPPSRPDRYTLYTAQEMIDLPEPPFLIESILPSQALAVLVGDYATYKSFVALDMALSIAGNHPWLGHDVEPGPALYISAEGGLRFGRRIQAWQYGRQQPLPDGARFLPQAVQLIKNNERTYSPAGR
ncbi:MAG TPA: AAA family ATPase [Chloroflexota bacterium]|jgi:hypothetical protein